jgi:hypothetical protein
VNSSLGNTKIAAMDSPQVQIRRANLRKWMEHNGVPPEERSYFGQLTGGSTSFGEKAARRLEREYNMGDGYLDRPLSEVPEAAAPAAPAVESTEPTYLARVTLEEMELLTAFRGKTPRGRQVIKAAAKVGERSASRNVRDHQG